MPNITLNKKVLEKLIGKKLSDDELQDRISMLGTDLQKIEGNEITVEVFPNRPDMLSEQGFARALSAFVGAKTGLKDYKVSKGGKDYQVIIQEPVKKVRPYTSCAIVKSLKMDGDSIKEIISLQEKLHITFGRNRKKLAIGIYPLEKIKLPITYTAKKPRNIKFQPLEASQEMDGLEMLQKHPAGREYAHLLEGKELFPVFIDSNDEVLSMPPIINSHKTGKVTEKTKDVFIECSGFDFKALNQCLSIIVTAMADMGGEIYSMALEGAGKNIITPSLVPEEKELDLKYINKMLGLELKESEIKTLLEKMGYGYRDKKVLVPAYRADILHPIDIAEDIAIAYGYENFEPEIPNVSTIGEEDEMSILKTRIANVLVGTGLIETSSYNLVNKDNHSAKMRNQAELVEVGNAVTKEYSCLRSWILPSLMQILSENTSREYPQEIFELGSAFHHDKAKETGVDEGQSLAIAICGADADFTRIKQMLDILMGATDKKYELKETNHNSFIKGRAASIMVYGQNIGILGELHPEVLSNFGIEMPAVGLELNISELHDLLKKGD
ncbi:phenylalanine--tRNA ligase subunit beta [Candidatus Woesearchaeota archaeon]|nr:phenylalanine--tRNA ligase subunit beta [Candidatus Woesearchaeota archaeon]